MINGDDAYDIVIDINSIMKLKEGWDIKMNEQVKEKIKSMKHSLVSVLGHSNRGKTYILQKICQAPLKPGYEVNTKGISIKLLGPHIMILDTVGSNAPLLVEKNKEYDPRDDPDFYPKQIHEMNLCKILTNYIVQTFVIHNVDTLICVVGMLTSSEQQFLNKIKKNCLGKKELIVIHNLIHCYCKKDIEDYIEQVLKKSIIHKFEEVIIPDLEQGNEKGEFFNKYYVEKNSDNKKTFDIKHFIMANDIDNDSKNGIRYFNEPTINFIRKVINQQRAKQVDIFEKLCEHIKNISRQILEKELTQVEISDNKVVALDDIKPKEVNADELDNIYFVGKDYEPPYRIYIDNDYFVIEIQICSEINMDKIDIKSNFKRDNEEFEFTITGEKFKKEEDNSNTIHELINKRTWKNFKLEFKVRLKDFNLNGLDPINKQSIYMEYGLLYIKTKANLRG